MAMNHAACCGAESHALTQPVDSFHAEPADEAQVAESCANNVADNLLWCDCRLSWPLNLGRSSMAPELPSVAEHAREPAQVQRQELSPRQGRVPSPQSDREGEPLGAPLRGRELSLRERYALQTGPVDSDQGYAGIDRASLRGLNSPEDRR